MRTRRGRSPSRAADETPSGGDPSRPLRLLFLNRSYYPDVEATGQLLTELCESLVRGYDVTVIAGQPNFVDRRKTGYHPLRTEQHNGVRVVRVGNARFSKKSFPGRAAGLLSYFGLALVAGLTLRRRPDAVVVETDPPFLGLLGALLSWWHGCPLVYYLQDLYPEVGLAMGRLRPGMVTTLLKQATQIGLRRASRVVVLGEDMRRRVLRRGIDPGKIEIIPNWVDVGKIHEKNGDNSLRRAWDVEGRFVVMYSGNVGLSQSLDVVLESAAQLRDQPVEFVFVGEGAAKPQLMAEAQARGLTNVRFFPYQPREQLSESLSAADLHLIPLKRGLAGCLVPSKLYGILAAGVPYVAPVDEDCEVALVTRRHGTGMVVEPDSATALTGAIRWCLDHRQELREMGKRGRWLAESEYDFRHAAAKFEQLIGSVCMAAAG